MFSGTNKNNGESELDIENRINTWWMKWRQSSGGVKRLLRATPIGWAFL